MEKYLPLLRACPLFDKIGDEHLMTMLHCLGAKVDFYDKKYTIIAEGIPATYIGVVLSGAVQIMQVDYYGNRSILGGAEPGELFGEAFACAEVKNMPVTIFASEPSEIMLINCSHILHTCENNCGFHQQLIFNLMKVMAMKTIGLHQRIEVTSKRSTREKLVAYLMAQAKRTGSSRFQIPYDRQALADYLEVDRSGLSAEIGKLTKEGVLISRKNYFELL